MPLPAAEAAEARRNARQLACNAFKLFALAAWILIAFSLIEAAMGGAAALRNAGLGLICAAGNAACEGE
jgi:hypothetical protein